MSKQYTKTIIREIRSSLGRFVAIIAIVALGVGFLVGILSSTPDMKATADKYYADHAMSDFNLKSTMGYTEDDIAAIEDLDEIRTVMPAKVTDSLVTINGSSLVAGRIYGLPMDNITVNQLDLMDGRMPENPSECVIENPTVSTEDAEIGDVITISPENSDVEDTYNKTEFKIVGIVDNPYYFCTSKEPSTAGNGRVGIIAYTYEEAYELDVYTDMFLLTNYTDSSFEEPYDQYIDKVTDDIEAVSDVRIKERHQEIVDEATEELDEAKETLRSERAKAENEFADAEQELADGQKELEDGREEIDSAKAEIEAGWEELNASRQEIEAGLQQLEAAKQQLEASKPPVEAGPEAMAQWQAAMDQWQANYDQLIAAQSQLETAEQELLDAEAEIEKGEQELEEAEDQLNEGRQELADGRAEAAAEFQKAENEIADAEKEISEIEEPEWYILDRDSNVSFAKYSVDVEKVASIATVFPIFFFLVAALVSLTTMTRMVEEERIQIGTLKALGYRRRTIISKYLIYCGVATVIGCILGLAAGFKVLPTVIFMAFESQYALPDLITQFNIKYAVISCVLEIICTLGATWLACNQSLREKPSTLMTPRAPKAGKRILLERAGFIWNRLSFTHKATARNVFRYKKHLFMTVIGIAGCTALIVAGFGIKDSLNTLVNTQFNELLKYDMKIELTEEKSDKELEDFLEGKDSLLLMTTTADVESGNADKKISTTVFVPEEPDGLKNYIVLRDRKTHDDVAFGKDSVVVGEKTAELLAIGTGDMITVTDPDGAAAEFKVTGITENYAGSYLYIAPDQYGKEFGKIKNNCYLLDSGITGSGAQDEAISRLLDSEYVASAEFTTQTRETYQIILDSLSFLVYVLILFAGLLAIVVLYNLTNININERIRELATLRVLGYHHKEVAMYIFREIGILTVIGIIAGLLLGKVLHYYVVTVAESADMMFGRALDPSTFLYAALLTLLFSILVDLMMLKKLRNIDMAASMKAID